MLDGPQFDLLPALRLRDHADRLVHVRLDTFDETGILLEGLLPAFHQRQALRRESRWQTELVHLHRRSQLHDQTLAVAVRFRRGPHPFDSRSRAVRSSGMPRGRDDLPERILHERGVIRIVLLGGEMDNVLRRVVMRHAGSVLADRHEVLAKPAKEEVDVDPRLPVVPDAAVLRRAVFLQCLGEGFPVSQGKGCLFDVEERPDLPVADGGVVLLLLCGERVVLRLRDRPAFVRPVAVFVPPVPDERDAFLPGLDALAPLLRAGEERVQVRPVAAPVAVEREDEGVEGRYPHVAGIEPRGRLCGLVEKDAAFRAGPFEGFGQKLLLALSRMLLSLILVCHIGMSLQWSFIVV